MTKTNIIYDSDALKGLKKLPDNCVHCCVTSPPYWGLRDYGVDGQLGLESTPEEFVNKMVQIFDEVKRVLRNDGTLWLNLGDSYAGGGNNRGNNSPISDKQKSNKGSTGQCSKHQKNINCKAIGLKPKDLVGIPWMVAFALRSAGWYLRQDIIWSKPNPMPESVKDRCTKSHEYIFLLSKSNKYYYDYESIKVPLAEGSYERKLRGVSDTNKYANGAPGSSAQSLSQPRDNIKKVIVGGKKHKNLLDKGQLTHSFHTRNENNKEWQSKDLKANKKSVWDVPTKGYKDAHFATFPEKLIIDCIKAGSSEYGCCSNCKTPYIRIIEKKLVPTKKASYNSKVDERDLIADKLDQGSNRMKDGHKPGWAYESKTLKWIPNCNCNASIEPCIILDPFMGSGTTAVVARKLNRNYVGIEINPKYIEISENRLSKELGMFK